jgi:hypothetical protein
MTTKNGNLLYSEVLPFIYRGCRFICAVECIDADLFQPHVQYESGISHLKARALGDDTAPYRTIAEARRHAQQQAIRWVHDQQGSGVGQM